MTFEARTSDTGLKGLLPKPGEFDGRGLIVCHACRVPLMFTQDSAFEIVPKKLLKRLPEVSRNFIRKHQEWYRQMQRQQN